MVTKISRFVYLAFAWLFSLGILMQVYLVGQSLLGGEPKWTSHIDLGHSLGPLPLLMILLAYSGKLPRNMKLLTWINFIVYVVLIAAVVTDREAMATFASLHPVFALVLFAINITLAVRISLLLRMPQPARVSERAVLPSTG